MSSPLSSQSVFREGQGGVELGHLEHSGRRGRLIGSLGYILAVLGGGTAPRGEKMVGGSRGTDSQDLGTILDPFRVIFLDLGPGVFC